jgi:non-ribosomal peptide synthetase component F
LSVKGNKTLLFREVRELANQVAHCFRNRGYKKGDAVALGKQVFNDWNVRKIITTGIKLEFSKNYFKSQKYILG